MTNTWFTADLHLGHQMVAELRGFSDPDEHDRMVLSNLSHTISRGDTLWILGDISAGGTVGQNRALDHLQFLRDEFGITLHLVAGNHDGVHPMHRRALRWDAEYRQVFASVQPFARRRIDGANVWLSHFPWRGGGDHTTADRYETVRLNDDGTSWLLHGHTHSPEPIDRERRMIHVGVDAWDMKPVSINTITDLLEDAT